jgi:hypothetical protein
VPAGTLGRFLVSVLVEDSEGWRLVSFPFNTGRRPRSLISL